MRLINAYRQIESFFDPRYKVNKITSKNKEEDSIVMGYLVDDFKNKKEIFISKKKKIIDNMVKLFKRLFAFIFSPRNVVRNGKLVKFRGFT